MLQMKRLQSFKKEVIKTPKTIEQVALALAKTIPDNFIPFCGTGITDFLQPIFQ